jgi:hypothetical protein
LKWLLVDFLEQVKKLMSGIFAGVGFGDPSEGRFDPSSSPGSRTAVSGLSWPALTWPDALEFEVNRFSLRFSKSRARHRCGERQIVEELNKNP